ncbi:hypothetical protein ULG90_12230 [Halopseudomonas pachastrellae]|nr:hypothetical protein ULG90_12230 [Halopseudomonas pachastrellae]
MVRVESDAGRVTHDGKTYQLSDLDGLRTLVAEAPRQSMRLRQRPRSKHRHWSACWINCTVPVPRRSP